MLERGQKRLLKIAALKTKELPTRAKLRYSFQILIYPYLYLC